jgi:CBS domain containing-hemolysin-like protein
MHRFAKCTKWIILLFNNTANAIAHRIFGIDPHYEPNESHSAEEIAMIVEAGSRSKEVTETEAEISMNALELNDRSVRDILVPRSRVEVLDINKSFEELLEQVLTSRHSRFALVSGHLDHAKGWIHVKDVLQMVHSGTRDIMAERRELKVVPETMKLDTLLDFFSKERTHCALVVDEHGSVTGQVYLDDVLEEIVGNDIQDEFEEEEARDFFPVGPNQYIASGAMALFDLEEALPALGEIESDSGVSTIGGHITDCLGHMPELNEHIRIRDYIITVTGTDGRRVTQTRIELMPQETN